MYKIVPSFPGRLGKRAGFLNKRPLLSDRQAAHHYCRGCALCSLVGIVGGGRLGRRARVGGGLIGGWVAIGRRGRVAACVNSTH